MDSITRYINLYEIIKKEMEYIYFQSLIPINTISPARTGGVLWIFTPQKIFCYLILLD